MIKSIIWQFKLPSNYIKHHLTHLQFNLIKFKFLNNLNNKYSFWILNIDSLFISLFLGFIFIYFIKYSINKIKYNSLFNKIYILSDIIILFIYKNVINICGKKDKYIFSLAFIVFNWIFLMNLMSLLPLDLISFFLKKIFNINNFVYVPSSDINITLAMSLGIFIIIFLYKCNYYGIFNLFKSILTHPFNYKICIPFNIIIESINLFSRFLSLSLRLFGNIYSGEIIFILIYFIVPFWLQWLFIFPLMFLHIFISFLQSFIFMILTLIYIS